MESEKKLSRPIRWGMVGGGQGSNIGNMHRTAASRDRKFQLVAGAFDINPERGKAFGSELGVAEDRCYDDYIKMFAAEKKREDGIEAVSIATPNGTHYIISKAALEAGLHVVCEKPLCFTSKEADELVELAEENNKVFGVTYGYTGHPIVRHARKMIELGELGDIRVISMQFAHGALNEAIEKDIPAWQWRLDPEKGGPSATLGDVGTHILYMAEVMVPNLEIDELLCVNNYFVEGRKLEDDAHVLIRFKNGIFGNMWASAINSGSLHGQIIRVVGSKASIQWQDDEPNFLRYEIQGKPAQILDRGASYLYPESLIDDRIGAGHAEGLFEAWSNLYHRFGQAMGAAISGDMDAAKAIWYPNVKDGANGVRFIEACIKSAEAGTKWINF